MARNYSVAWHCKCGGAVQVDGRTHRAYWQALIDSFVQLHNNCITAVSKNDIEEPGGDVFTQAERGGQQVRHELQIGFQREEW